MRFVVALDLFATFTMPAACAYLVYLIVASIQSQTAPTISLILMAAAYGLQMIIFMLKRKFEHIGWMIISFLAFPFFWFYLPLYSFWHFDDFSWGNTRRVAGSNGKDTHVADADFFDPSIIPAVTWEKYVQDVTSQHETEKATKSAGLEPGEYIQASAKLEHSTSLSMDQNSRLSYAAPTTLSVPGYAPSDVSGAAPSSLAASAMASSIVAPSISYAPSGTAPVGYAAPYPPDMVMLNHQSLIPGLPTMVGMPGMPMMADPMDMRALAAAMPVVHEDTIEGMPSDEEIVYQIRVLLSTHDLQTLTKKKVREELAAIFGVDMTPKKQFIGEIVEGIINGEI